MFVFPSYLANKAGNSGDKRLILDLIALIAKALKVSPRMILPGEAASDEYRGAFFINVKPSSREKLILDKNRSLSIAIQNDVTYAETDICDVILDAAFNPYAAAAKDNKVVFNYTTLPSRVTPGIIRAAAEKNTRLSKEERLPSKGTVVAIVLRSLSKECLTDLKKSLELIGLDNSNVTFLVTTGPHTPVAHARNVETLFSACSNAYVYRWRATGRPNPFLTMLGMADLIITGDDTLSTLSDCIATQKRVYLLARPTRRIEYFNFLYAGVPVGNDLVNACVPKLHCDLMQQNRLRLFDPISVFDPWKPTRINEWGPIAKGIVDQVFQRIESNPKLSGKFHRPAGRRAPAQT